MTTYYNLYYYPNYQRPEISYFSGENVDGRLYELEGFFYRYQTTVEQKLAIATSYLAGDALEWYRQWCWDMRLSWRIGTWDDFAADLRCRFWSKPLTRPSMILESMSKTCDGIIQLLTEMKNENSVYMSNLSKLKSQVNSISTSGSSVDKVEESDLDCGVPAADVVSTDDANFESATVAILEDLGNPKSDEMNSEVVAQCLNLELHKKVLFTTVVVNFLPVVEAEIGKRTKTLWFGAPFCTLSNIVTSCLQPVCENASMIIPSIFMKNTVLFGSWHRIKNFQGVTLSLNPPKKPPDSFLNALEVLKQFGVADISFMILNWLYKIDEVSCWILIEKHQTEFRWIIYVQVLLNQEMVFYDMYGNHGDIVNHVLSSVLLLQYTLGDTVDSCCLNMAMPFTGIVSGFSNCWAITLTTLWARSFIVFSGGVSNIFFDNLTEKIQDAYVEVESSIIPEQCLLRWKFLLMFGDLNCGEHLIVGQPGIICSLCNPPWEPPDDTTQRKFKFMSVLMSKNDEIKIINEEDLCIGWKEAEAKQGVTIEYKLGKMWLIHPYISWLQMNMSSILLSKDDLVRIEMKKVKFDDSYRSAACVEGWKDDYIRALVGRHSDDKYGASQENDIAALKNYMGAEFLSKGGIGTPNKLVEGVMSRKIRHIASRLIHLYVGQDLRSAYMGQENLFFPQLRVSGAVSSLTAELHLPELSSVESDEYAINPLFMLGRVSSVDTIIGDSKFRGVSADEKIHHSLACVLVASPSMIFTDGLTTGHDVFQAKGVIETLRDLALNGHIVIYLSLCRVTVGAMSVGFVNVGSFAASTVGLCLTAGAMAVEPFFMTNFIVLGYYIDAEMTPIVFDWFSYKSLKRGTFEELCSKDMCEVARCEIHNVIEVDNQSPFLILTTMNELYPGYICVGQRKKLAIFWCVVITYELKRNLFAKWLAQVQLAWTNVVKMRFVSRIYTSNKFHPNFLVLAGFKHEVFATQVTIWDIAVGFGSPAMNLLYHLSFWFSSPRPPESNDGKSSLSLLERTFARSFIIIDRYNQEVETYFILYGGAVAGGPRRSICTNGSCFDNLFLDDFVSSAGYITFLCSHCQGHQTLLTLRTR